MNNIKNMVAEWLISNNYQGLCNEIGGCGCVVEELAPCCSISGSNCVAAYKADCINCKNIDYCNINSEDSRFVMISSDTLLEECNKIKNSCLLTNILDWSHNGSCD